MMLENEFVYNIIVPLPYIYSYIYTYLYDLNLLCKIVVVKVYVKIKSNSTGAFVSNLNLGLFEACLQLFKSISGFVFRVWA